ncbi:MAG: response regulator [Desulfobacterales bacterium]|nr:response regulator [Desulfobacterales bacterium]
MIRNVLIVDDDQEMLLALKEGLEKYRETFTVSMAGDGLIAVDKLKQSTFSLVVADLKMPGMDGFSLLAHIMKHYPDIPVIIITAYSTPKMEKLAWQGGAVGYIAKPFMIEDLAKKMMETIRKESEGGTLHSVSSGMFLQLVEMEQKTCTIRLSDKKTDLNGVLFFRDGELMDARVDDLQGKAAAYKIFAWDEVNLSIQNICNQKENLINSDLQPIILDAMRLKDEANDRENSETEDEVIEELELEPVKPKPPPAATPKPPAAARPKAPAATTPKPAATAPRPTAAAPKAPTPPAKPRPAGTPDFMEQIKQRVKREMGDRCVMEDIFQDDSWNPSLAGLNRLGDLFPAGELKAVYLDKERPHDFILLPGKTATVLSVNPKCPRDKLLKILTE